MLGKISAVAAYQKPNVLPQPPAKLSARASGMHEDRTTLSARRPLIGQGGLAEKFKLTPHEQSVYKKAKRFLVKSSFIALAVIGAFVGLMVWLGYALEKAAVRNGIKEAASDGAFTNPSPRQPVVVISGRNQQ